MAVCEARGLSAGGGQGHGGQQAGGGRRHLDRDLQQVGGEHVESGMMRIVVRYNSGTYNNQWMVVNMNLFKPLVKANYGRMKV